MICMYQLPEGEGRQNFWTEVQFKRARYTWSQTPGKKHCIHRAGASRVAQAVKNPPATVGDERDSGSIPGSGRSPGGGNGNPLQYSCLENPTDRGAQQATVHGVTQSQTRLERLSTHTHSRPSQTGSEALGDSLGLDLAQSVGLRPGYLTIYQGPLMLRWGHVSERVARL